MVALDEVLVIALDFWTKVVLGLSWAVLAADTSARTTCEHPQPMRWQRTVRPPGSGVQAG